MLWLKVLNIKTAVVLFMAAGAIVAGLLSVFTMFTENLHRDVHHLNQRNQEGAKKLRDWRLK